MKTIGIFLGVKPHAGGMFQYAQSLLDALSTLPKEKFHVHVAVADETWEPILAQYPFTITIVKNAHIGLKIADFLMASHLPASFVRHLTTFINPIAYALRKIRANLWIFPAQDAISYQLKLPSLVSIHDLMHRYEPRFPEASSCLRYFIREQRFKNIVRFARGILVDSNAGKQHVIESYQANPKIIYPLPYIPPRYIFEQTELLDIRKKYGLPEKFIFYPAQFWAHKNHAALISAAHLALKDNPDLHLVFTGEKKHEYEKIYAHALTLNMQNRLSFCGYVPNNELPSFYRAARAFIMPTFFGPTNIPPLEAIACNCPVAVSAIYAMPEQLGDAAIYFDPNSLQDMANTLTKLWQDDNLLQALRNAGNVKLNSWNTMAFSEQCKNILASITSEA